MPSEPKHKSAILAAEAGTISTSSGLLQYLERIGMIHLNRNPQSRSAGNVWDWSNGDVYHVLLELMEDRKLFVCRAVEAKRTFAKPEVGVALVQLAGERTRGLSVELGQVYQLIRMEGPLTRRDLSELCGYSSSRARNLLDRLIDRLLIVPLAKARSVQPNWPELSYWTVDEWLLDQDLDSSGSLPVDQAEEVVLSAAAKCLMTESSHALAKALRWPEKQVRAAWDRIDPSGLREVHEPVRIGGQS